MRIVHTSDWHAGRLWKRVPRLDELGRALASMADYVEREGVDLVLMTGDVFDSGSPHPDAERLVFQTLKRLGQAAPVVLIAGNHDDPRRLEAWGTFAELANVRCIAKPRRPEQGGLLEVRSRNGRELALVAPIPFAPIRWFVSAAGLADEGAAMQSYAERVAELAATFAASFRPDAVNILMAHTHVEGAKLARSERTVHLGDQWAVTPAQIPTAASYVALGHIHKPQAVRHGVEYAGSPLQLDFGEEGEDKSFVVVEAAAGVPAKVWRVSYEGGTPLKTFRGGWVELEAAAEVLRAAGHLRVFLRLAEMESDVVKRVKELVPNAVSVQLELPEIETSLAPRPGKEANAPDLYRAYCERRYGATPDPAVIEAFKALWDEADK
jgi:exonuclease SbcD